MDTFYSWYKKIFLMFLAQDGIFSGMQITKSAVISIQMLLQVWVELPS